MQQPVFGAYTFSTLNQFLLGIPQQLASATPGSAPDRTFRWSTFGFYVQDDWRVTPRFTANLGLRYEFNDTINETSGRGASLRDFVKDAAFTISPPLYRNPSLRNFGPRVGFAWDVFGNSAMSVPGGFALLYDITNLLSAASGIPPFTNTSTATANVGFSFAAIPAGAAGKTLRTKNL